MNYDLQLWYAGVILAIAAVWWFVDVLLVMLREGRRRKNGIELLRDLDRQNRREGMRS